VIIFFFTKFSLNSLVVTASSFNVDVWFICIVIYASIILIVDVKLLMYTKNFTILSVSSILFLSIILYIIYLFIADQVNVFKIYKTAIVVLSSSHFYFIMILVVGVSVIVDVLYIVLVREVKTPIYLLFKSLMERKNLTFDERTALFKVIVDKIKSNIYEY
jgi:hypothetical protein